MIALFVFVVVFPAYGKTRTDSFNVPCSNLWRAVRNTLANSGNYQITGINDSTMMASYLVGNELSGQQINYVGLSVNGNTCAMQVQAAFRGLVHDDAGDFKKRVQQSLSMPQFPEAENENREAAQGTNGAGTSQPFNFPSVPRGADQQTFPVPMPTFAQQQGPQGQQTFPAPGAGFAQQASPLDQLNGLRVQAGLPPLVDAQAGDPEGFSQACLYDLRLLSQECQQGLGESCTVGQSIESVCSGGAGANATGGAASGNPNYNNCVNMCRNYNGLSTANCMGGDHKGICSSTHNFNSLNDCIRQCGSPTSPGYNINTGVPRVF